MEMPVSIRDVAHLEELLSEPSDAAVDAMRRADGDVIVLGVAGKMGPTLARMARRAMDAAGHRHRPATAAGRDPGGSSNRQLSFYVHRNSPAEVR